MSRFKIEITENGVSVLTRKIQTLFDDAGNPVEVDQGNHRQAIGVEDFETVEEFRTAIDALCVSIFGKNISDAVADLKVSQDELDAANARIRVLEENANTNALPNIPK